MNIKIRDFESQILYFNGMYKLPVSAYPAVKEIIENEQKKDSSLGKVTAVLKRLNSFHHTLSDEVKEVHEIMAQLALGFKIKDGIATTEIYTELDFLTDMADWLGDIQIYCTSEMAKFGIPLKETLAIIMSSNFSKLDANGQPIYDSNGKVQKGSAYWKPEPQIKAMLEERIADGADKNKISNGIIWEESSKGKNHES